ncbi:hypothetical protein Dalk_4552 [Desulfatibacillum aliphaticivorans]|uniref:Uncharacterized protein n=1 Tax=Desulfatibacillum aliphaticivorans TaxID=218208 RepID=B8FCR7_DESAL|nr:hypothetical protein [Desulfatibacillum aliphaticivorans]ACL06230.1 hypothetical protein Dalk_4552 [Desulfatibacillum aliphaticivorans]
MAYTASQIIDSALRDLPGGISQDWQDYQLLDYLNRAVRVLDSALASLGSDWVEADADITLSEDGTTASVPTRCMVVKEVWNSANRLTKKTPDFIRQRQRLNGTSTGSPYYWAHAGTNLIFDRTADQDYTLKAHYKQYSADLELTDNMPYDDQFNDELRSSVVILVKAKNSSVADDGKMAGVLTRADYEINKMFTDAVRSRAIARGYVKRRRGDF